MKITFVLPYAGLQGGVRVIATHANRLSQRGHHVTVVSVPQQIRFRSRIKAALMGDLHRGLQEPSHFDGTCVVHRVLDRVRDVTDGDVEDADVVIATHYSTAPGVQRLSRRKGAKAIFIQGYEVAPGQQNPQLDASWRMPFHKIVVSKWLATLARERFGDENCSLVPNSVDPSIFHAPPRSKSPRPTIGFVYSSYALKGTRTVLGALQQVHTALPDVRAICFGTERPDFRLSLPAFVEFHFRPEQSQLRRLYSQCDVWVCASLSEGFGLPLVEAMACRCPVVSTKCGGPSDFIDEASNGFLVEVGDERALGQTLLRTLNLPERQWKEMSDSALKRTSHFSWDDAAHEFEKALRAACAAAPVSFNHCPSQTAKPL